MTTLRSLAKRSIPETRQPLCEAPSNGYGQMIFGPSDQLTRKGTTCNVMAA